MSSKFTRKQEFKLKKIKRLIYMRNINRIFNKKELIENTMQIYKKKHKKRIKINIIDNQK